MNATLLNNGTIRLEITREELHTVRDALLESVEHLEDGIAKREQLISKLAGADPGEIAEALEEKGLEDSLEDLQRGLKGIKIFCRVYKTLAKHSKNLSLHTT